MNIYTIGHSTRSEGEFVDLLHRWGVDMLIDVRGKWPYSRHNPQHNKENMEQWLPAAGIKYHHIPKLGGWQPKQRVDPSVNGGWRRQGMHNYADYTLTDDFAEGLQELYMCAEGITAAYMCAEAVPWRCHRLLLSNVVVQRATVQHIMNTKQCIEHELGRWGAQPTLRDNHIVYPA